MKLLLIRSRTFVFHAALVALYALAAVAFAAVPSAADLVHSRFSKASKPRRAIVTFQNGSVQLRELQIGENRFSVAPRGSVRLSVTVGSDVRVYNPLNSRPNGTTFTTVPDASALHDGVID